METVKRSGSDPATPDDITLDAVDGPDGRAVGAAMKYYRLAGPVGRPGEPPAQGMLVDYALYKYVGPNGGRRLAKTKELTAGDLKSFQDYVKANGGCKCKRYFLAQ